MLSSIDAPLAVNACAFKDNFPRLGFPDKESVLVSQCMECHLCFEFVPVVEILPDEEMSIFGGICPLCN